MDGVTIKIFYGYRYHDDEYDIDKTGYDYEIIGDSQDSYQSTIQRLRDKIRLKNLNYTRDSK